MLPLLPDIKIYFLLYNIQPPERGMIGFQKPQKRKKKEHPATRPGVQHVPYSG